MKIAFFFTLFICFVSLWVVFIQFCFCFFFIVSSYTILFIGKKKEKVLVSWFQSNSMQMEINASSSYKFRGFVLCDRSFYHQSRQHHLTQGTRAITLIRWLLDFTVVIIIIIVVEYTTETKLKLTIALNVMGIQCPMHRIWQHYTAANVISYTNTE